MHHSRPFLSAACCPLRDAWNFWRNRLGAKREFDLRTFLIVDLIVSMLLIPILFGVIWWLK